MLSPKEMRELHEFEVSLEGRKLSEEQAIKLSCLYSGWMTKRKENRRMTTFGLSVSTIMLLLMAARILPVEFYNSYTLLGIITVIVTSIGPAYNTYYGRHMQRLCSELAQIEK